MTYNLRCMAVFYQSEDYDEWLERTSEEMRHAKPFVLKPTASAQ